MASLSDTLRERGYVQQCSSETLEEITDGQKRTLYLGIDPTADSLHVGHLQAMLVLRRFLEGGHKVILLIGGGTGMIGDPSGKSEERNLLDEETIARNAAAVERQAKMLFGGLDFKLRNNADWLGKLNLIEFLRDTGKHFSVNAMLQRDSVRTRLESAEQGISYTEFSYMLLQAYDFLHLHRTENCDLQIGGSDQWGNIASGIDLIRRASGDVAYGMTLPLLIDRSTGKKFGKSESGSVWLDPLKTTPFQFYQFWLNTEDAMIEELLLKMTVLPKNEIDMTMGEHAKKPGARIGQRLLAAQVTTLVHGAEHAESAMRVSEILFGDTDVSHIPVEDLELLKTGPSVDVRIGEHCADVLVSAGLAASKREAREFLVGGAVTLNGVPVGVERILEQADFKGGIALLKRGKRNVCTLILA